MALTVGELTSTECFVQHPDGARQVLRATVSADFPPGSAARVEVRGRGVRGEAAVGPGSTTVEVPVETGEPPGRRVAVRAALKLDGEEVASASGHLEVAEPGWTVHMVSHFHYDPVWWNTQAAYTSGWDFLTDDGLSRPLFEHNGFALVKAHVEMALRDRDYRFVLAELDYLKPFWDSCPEYRPAIRSLLEQGRLELMGGTYNEPNTNLTGSETTIRNIVYGMGYQRDILGGDPQTGWQLDVFGHDPQFPGLLEAAGLSSSAWARGPFHQWGPAPSMSGGIGGDTSVMQFPSEFEWVSPSGRGVLTHYMPNHYSAGWWMDAAASLEDAEEAVYKLFLSAKKVAATRNTLLPVGTDYTPPNLWVTAIHRDWATRYCWPRIVCSTPRQFFAAVREELGSGGRRATPQSRDMNPIYTGKDVSFVDTKQAQRACEVAARDAELLATLACLLADGEYPERALDKVWRQLAYGAHHDAITGSESDQVYIDLLAGWREARDLALEVRERALGRLLARVSAPPEGRGVVVVNTLAGPRSGVVQVDVHLDRPAASVRIHDDDGAEVPFCVLGPDYDGPRQDARLQFLAKDVPGVGWRSYCVRAEPRGPQLREARWRVGAGAEPQIENDAFRVAVDPRRGGCLVSVVERSTGRELLREGAMGNELRLYEEYPAHPRHGEGPWHLLPSGPWAGSSARPAEQVRVERCPLGQRIVVTSRLLDMAYEQVVTLWDGVDMVDCTTRVLDFSGKDQLLRARIPVEVHGGLPVSEVAGAAIGRGFAFPDVDSASHPWTLDNPANTWFALGATAHVSVRHDDGAPPTRRAIGVVEVVVPDGEPCAEEVHALVVALARRGVTATTSQACRPRYGWLQVDSNLPDARIVIGGPDANPLSATLLDALGPRYRELLRQGSGADGATRLWVAADLPLRQVWQPGADLRGLRQLPALVVAPGEPGALGGAVRALAEEMSAQGSLQAVAPAPTAADLAEDLEDLTVGVLSAGTPGFAVDVDGGLSVSLLRSCSGWPSGVWIDPPRRSAPDGSAFQLQHWTHEFRYGLVCARGDWRAGELPRRGQAFSSPLLAREHPGLPRRGQDEDEGTLGTTATLVSVEPADRVVLQAVKAAGNPSATGRRRRAEPGDGVTLRLVEVGGASVTARVGGELAWASARRASLLEEPTGAELDVLDGAVQVALGPSEIATLLLTPSSSRPAGATVALGPEREPGHPSYARYWLHNRGPAPMGFLPLGLAVEPTSTVLRSPHVDLRISVASQLVAERAEGMLRVRASHGWLVEPSERLFSLAAGAHTSFRARIVVPVTPAPGLYLVTVSATSGSDAVEDAVSLVVPGRPAEPELPGRSLLPQAHQAESVPDPIKVRGTSSSVGRQLGCDVSLRAGAGAGPGSHDGAGDGAVHLRAGGSACVSVVISNRAASALRGELQLVSPWGTWDFVSPARRAVEVGAGETIDVTTTLRCPPGTRPGAWWLLAKWMWFGRVQYTPAIPLVVAELPS